MARPRKVTKIENMEISEISAVDKGANPHATAVLVKRDVSTEEREKLADKGKAMPDGSYPIANESDLKNAIQSFGRAKNKAAVKAHIIRRAKALGKSDLIPDNWVSKNYEEATELLNRIGHMLGIETAYGDDDEADSDEHGLDFNTAYRVIEAKEYAADVLEEVQEACEALYRSVHSILDDEEITEPSAALQATISQFKAHMAGLVPESMEKAFTSVVKALAGAAGSTTDNDGDTMSEDINKALADKDAEINRLTALVKSRFTAEESAYHASLDDVAKAKFADLSPEDRAKELISKSLTVSVPEHIAKRLAEAEAIEKRLAALEAERESERFAKRAADAGLSGEWAEHLHVIAKASPKAAEAVEKLAKSLAAVEKKSGLFHEVGSASGPDATSAEAQLNAVAHDIAKRDSVSFAAAFTKACSERSDLYRQYRAERV